jgi:5-formyltetrahydrofolate cyclo-ligase
MSKRYDPSLSDQPEGDLPRFEKQALRASIRDRRRAYAASLDTDTRGALEAALADALASLFTTARVVAAYAPMIEEISPLGAMDRASAAGCTLAYPYFVDRDSRMTFRTGEPVEPGPWGILQPAPDAGIVSPDLILMPLIAVDDAGNRIGMGKGHYDRALPGLRAAGARLIGCGWSFQLIEQRLVPDAWDVPLDGFASPDGLELFE